MDKDRCPPTGTTSIPQTCQRATASTAHSFLAGFDTTTANTLGLTYETADSSDDVDMEEEKKAHVPKTMTDAEREKFLQTNHELQLLSAAEQPAELFLAEYETPAPYKKPTYIPAIYHTPSRAKLFN